MATELTVEMTYGTALYQVALESDKVEVILEETRAILDAMKDEPDLMKLISNPTIAAADKKDVIENIFGGKISEELLHFIFVVIDKRRTMGLERMLKTYETLADEEEGYIYGKVFSVEPLSEIRIEELEQETSNLLKQNVRLANELDPKLIGGVKILVDGRIIDATYRKKFDDLAQQIRSN